MALHVMSIGKMPNGRRNMRPPRSEFEKNNIPA